MEIVNLELGQDSYPIYIGSGLIQTADLVTSHIKGNRALIVTNETVAPLYQEQLENSLCGINVDVVVLPDGERFKTLETLTLIFDALLQNNHNRQTTIIALGGGVVGDMAGFAAASYQRGVDFIQVPTTLLSQVDSSVGGKTAVNHPLGKNMIGAFYQPQCVLIDTNTLATLPARELSAGLAEVIKHGALGDREYFDWLELNIEGLLAMDAQCIAQTVKRSCEIKAEIVGQDEKEQGIRALLNFGHTFGHAIENGLGYGEWLHGEAVGAGMVMAADLSVRLGMCDREGALKLRDLIAKAGLPIVPPPGLVNQFTELMGRDKKVSDSGLRLVLLEALGKAKLVDNVDDVMLQQTISGSDRLLS
jgi:3-dehydroquinate synthase